MTKITIAIGDSIGPEIMDATLSIILTEGAKIDLEEIQLNEKDYLKRNTYMTNNMLFLNLSVNVRPFIVKLRD